MSGAMNSTYEALKDKSRPTQGLGVTVKDLRSPFPIPEHLRLLVYSNPNTDQLRTTCIEL
jgi:hypothetical protein